MADLELEEAVKRLEMYSRHFDAVTRAGISSLQSDLRRVLEAHRRSK